MATQVINTTGCNSDCIVRLSIPQIRGTVGTVLTIKDNGLNEPFFASNSIVISTTSGYSIYGGGNTEYIRRSGDALSFALMSSNWVLMNTFAYTTQGYALLSNVSTTNFFGLGSASLNGVTIKGELTNYGPIDQQNLPTIQGIPVVNQSNLFSTVEGLGSLGYFSSVPKMMDIFISTIDGLDAYGIGYVSYTKHQSTIAGLGSTYVSTGALTSTMAGIGNVYISSKSLVSTVVGLASAGYISTTQVVSTVQGLGSIGYISTPQVVSTVNWAISVTASNNTSTFNTIGLLYISTPSLVSTVIGASNIYINSNQFASTTVGLIPYFSTPIISTVAGLGSSDYISTYSFYSTIDGINHFNRSTVSHTLSSLGYIYVSSLSLQSTVAGLGTGFISLSQLTSTTTGALADSFSNMNSTVEGLGQTYTSTLNFFSTVIYLSNLPSKIIPSTLDGLGITYISSLTLRSTVAGLGQYYISIDQLKSTTSNIISTVVESLPSTLAGLASIGYISFAQTISTVSTIAGINQSTLISTVRGLGQSYVSSGTLQSTVAGLGQYYISLDQLTSTTSNVMSVGKGLVQSTFVGLGTVGYISYAQTVSTVSGFCNMNRSNLISTVDTVGSLYISSLSLQSTVAGLGTYGYVSLSQLTSTTSNITKLASDYILSTLLGMSNVGYVSISQLSSTLNGVRPINRNEFISTVNSFGQTYISSLSLRSTVEGLGSFGYISLSWLVSTTHGLTLAQSNTIFTTVARLGSLTFISTSQLLSTVEGIYINTERTNTSTLNTLGKNYVSSLTVQSTVAGLGTMNFVTPEQAGVATNTVNDRKFIVNPGLLPAPQGFDSLDDKVNQLVLDKYLNLTIPQALSTTSNLRVIYSSNLVSTVNTLGSNYIKTGLTSTVIGLGSYEYISISVMMSTTSTMVGLSSNDIASTFIGLGTAGYISMPDLVSTTEGVFSNAPFFTSTVDGLGSLYISSLSLQSTVSGLSNFYVTSARLVSTTLGLSNPTTTPGSMFSSVAGLGGAYISSQSLQSTVAGLGTTYISTATLASTVRGLGSFGYLSTGYLTSTFTGYSNPMPEIISTTVGLGQFYVSSVSDSIIIPDLYRTQTKYRGIAITAVAYAPNVIYFTDSSNIYSSPYTSFVPTKLSGPVPKNITGLAAYNDFLFLSLSNMILGTYMSGYSRVVIANTNNTSGFANSSDSNVRSSADNVSFRSIQGICIDSTFSNLYICDTGNNAIRRLQTFPFSLTTIARINQPFSVAVDSLREYLYVSGSEGISRICLFQSNITLLTTQGAYSRGITIDSSGTLAYVTSQLYSSVLEVTLSNGSVSPLAGTSGNPGLLDGTSSLFYAPQGILYNPVDTCIYVADTGNSAIRQIATRIYYSTIQGMNSRGYASNIAVQVPSGGNTSNFIATPSLQLWLDAADPNGTGTAPANGTILSIWKDKSGNSNDASAVSVSLYSNGYIQLFPNSYFVSSYVMNSTEQHIFIVCQYSNSGTYDINLVSGLSNDSIQLYIYNNILVVGSPFSSQNYAKLTPSVPFITEVITTPTYSKILINNSLIATGGGYKYGISRIQIGGNPVNSMYMCEVLMYNRIEQNVSSLFTSLNTKWVAPAAVFIQLNSNIEKANVPIGLLALCNAAAAIIVRQPGIQMWLDSADPNGTGIFPEFGTNVTTWADKSGNGNNAVGGGLFSSNGIIFLGNNSYTTPIATNSKFTYMYIVFSNTINSGYRPLIGASQGSNVGYELILSNSYPAIDKSYPANSCNVDYPQIYNLWGYSSNLPIVRPTNPSFPDINSFNAISMGFLVGSGPVMYVVDNESSLVLTFLYLRKSTGSGYAWQLQQDFDGVINFAKASYYNSSFHAAFDKWMTEGGSAPTKAVCSMPRSVAIQTDFNNEWIVIANDVPQGSTTNPQYVWHQTRRYIFSMALGSADSYTILTMDSGIVGSGGGNHICYYTFNINSNGFVTSYNNAVEIGSMANDSSLPITTFETSVFNPVDGYNYYTANNQVWRIRQLRGGVPHEFVAGGRGGQSGFAEGIGSQAIFGQPLGITADEYGNLYVADRVNSRIRVLVYPTFRVTSLNGLYKNMFGIAFNKRPYYYNGTEDVDTEDYTYMQYLFVTCTEYGTTSKVIKQIPLTIRRVNNEVLVSTSAVTPANTIISASFVNGTVSAKLGNGTSLIDPTDLDLYYRSVFRNGDPPTGGYPKDLAYNSNTGLYSPEGNALFSDPGTYQIGKYFKNSPIYLIGSIQEVIIYTSETSLSLPDTAIRDYLSRKWNSNTSGYYSPIPRPYIIFQVAPVLTSPYTPPGYFAGGTATTSNFGLYFDLNSITSILINSNLYAGNITAGSIKGKLIGDGTNVTSISDRRLKEDIHPIMNALEKVSSMQAVKYRMYTEPSQLWIGYIAQDLEVILPEVVRTDAEGWKSIQYTNLPALIIEAVKELNEKYTRIKYLLSTSS